MKYRALLRHLERKLPEPPPDEIIVGWVNPDEPKPDRPERSEPDPHEPDPNERRPR